MLCVLIVWINSIKARQAIIDNAGCVFLTYYLKCNCLWSSVFRKKLRQSKSVEEKSNAALAKSVASVKGKTKNKLKVVRVATPDPEEEDDADADKEDEEKEEEEEEEEEKDADEADKETELKAEDVKPMVFLSDLEAPL